MSVMSNIVGIDIGNEKCVVAIVKPKAIQILMNHDAKYEIPSVVSFTKKKRQIGTEKASLAMMNPENTITQVKRLIGQNFDEPGMAEELKLFPFKTSKADDGGILIHVNYLGEERTFTPVQILAMLLCHLKQMIERSDVDLRVSDLVISVPSYFNDLQRIAYLNAAEIAGLKPPRLMNDGAAIALGYGYFKRELDSPVIVVFVDVGHSDTQVTVARFDREGARILSHAFDRNLGGRDFDRVLYNHFLENFSTRYKIDIESNPRATVRLMSACEKVKTVLTANREANISVDCLVNGVGVDGSIQRDDFDEMSTDLLKRLRTTLETALTDVTDAKLKNGQINSVELVGSGSRIPAISRVVRAIFGMEPSRTLNGSDCVARGCALQLSMLSGNRGSKDYKVQDSIPFSVGLSWISSDDRDANSVSNPSDSHQISSLLFEKGVGIPSTKIVEFPDASQEFQFSTFYEYKGGSTPSLSQKSRTFEVDIIEIDLNKSIPVRVEISIELDGMIIIKSASQPNSVGKIKNRQEITREKLKFNEILPIGMSKGSITKAQECESGLLQRDRDVDDVQRQKNDIEAFIYSTRKEFQLNGRYDGYTKKSEKERILKKLDASETWLFENDDEESAVYSNELHALKELVNSIESRYKHFIDCMEATKELHVSIAELNRLLKSKKVANYYDHYTGWLWAVNQLLTLLPKDIDQLPYLLGNILKITRLTMEERCRLSESRTMEDCHLTMATCSSLFRDANKYSLYECHEGERKKREKWLLVDETCTRLSKLLDTIAQNSFGEDDELYHETTESPLEENDQDNLVDKHMSEIQQSKETAEDSSNNAVVPPSLMKNSKNRELTDGLDPSSSEFNREQQDKKTVRTTEEVESINSTISDIQLKLSESYGDFIDQQEKNETDNKLNEIKNRLLDFGIGDNELYNIVTQKIFEFREHLSDVEVRYMKEETTGQRKAQLLYMIFDSRIKIMCIAISGSGIIRDNEFNSLEERVRNTCDDVEMKSEEMKSKEDMKILKRLQNEIQQFEEAVIEKSTVHPLQQQIHPLADIIKVETENEVALLEESISDIEKKVFGRYRYVARADEQKYISKIIKKISGLLQRRGRTGDASVIWSREKGELENVIATLEIRYKERKSEISLAAEELCDCIFDHLRMAKSEIFSSFNATLIKKRCDEDEKWLEKNFQIAKRGNPINKIEIDTRREELNKYCEGIKRNDPHNISRRRMRVRNPFNVANRN